MKQFERTSGERAGQPLSPGVRVEAVVRGSVRRGTVIECGARVAWDDESEPAYVPARDLRPVGAR